MTIGAVFPEISQPGGPAAYIQRFAKNAPGRRIVVATGMSPLMQQRLHAPDDAVVRRGYGDLEIAYSPMLWPFRQQNGIASDQLRYPTVPAEQYERLFARIFEQSGRPAPEVFLQQGLEYAPGNVARGLAQFDNGRHTKVILPFTNFDETISLSAFDIFDHALYLSPHQRQLWNDRLRNAGRPHRLRSTVIPPLLDPYLLSPGRQPLFPHPPPKPSNESRIVLVPVPFWTKEEGERVISGIHDASKGMESVVVVAPDPANLTTSAESTGVWQHIAELARRANITLMPAKMTPSSMIDFARRADAVVLPRATPSREVVGSIASLELMYAGVPAVHLSEDLFSRPQAIHELTRQLNGACDTPNRAEDLDLLADLSVISAPTDLYSLMRELSKSNRQKYGKERNAALSASDGEGPDRWAVRATRTMGHLRSALPEVPISGNSSPVPSVVGANSAKPQALFLMDTGNPQAVLSAVSASTELGVPLYVLCSNDDEVERLRTRFPPKTRLGKNVHLLNVQWLAGIEALHLPVDQHSLTSAHIQDLAMKRNAALLLSAKLGYDVIAMLDNDVHAHTARLSDMIVRAAEHLVEHPELQSVGVPYGTDNDTYDHAYWFYTTIGRTDLAERHAIDTRSFHGGGFHLLRVKGSDPFPAIYDDDLFQIARLIRRNAIALLAVNAGQLSPLALRAHHRPALEEAGDCIAETILRSIVDGGVASEVLRVYDESPRPLDFRERAHALLARELSVGVAERYAARLDLASLLPASPKSTSKERSAPSDAQLARKAILEAAAELTSELPALGAGWFLSYLDSAERWREIIDAVEPLRTDDIRSAIRDLGGNVPKDFEPQDLSLRAPQWADAIRCALTAGGDPYGLHAAGPLIADRHLETRLQLSERDYTNAALLRVWSRLPGSAPESPEDWTRLAAAVAAVESDWKVRPLYFGQTSVASTPSEVAGRMRLNLPDGPVHRRVLPWYEQLSHLLDEIGRLGLDVKAQGRLQSLRGYVAVRAVDYSVRQTIADRVDSEVERMIDDGCVPSFESRIEGMTNVLYEMPAAHRDPPFSSRAGVPILELLLMVDDLHDAALRGAGDVYGRSSGQATLNFEATWLAAALAPSLDGSSGLPRQDHIDHILREITVNGYRGFTKLLKEERQLSRSPSL
jgi:hypothetical protein